MKPAEEVIGAVGLTVMTVRAGDTSVAMGIGDLPIVSQSQLISLMEHAAIISMDEHLEPEETTIPIATEVSPARTVMTVKPTAPMTSSAGFMINNLPA